MSNAINLVDYLIKLTDIGREPIRSVDKFERVLWLYEIPTDLESFCFTVASGIESEHADDVWMYVKKCNEPRVPFVPVECRDWVVTDSIKNPDVVPMLKESVKYKKNPVTGEKYEEIQTVYLLDFPEIEEIWNAYIENDWKPWSEDYQKFNRVLKVYSALFDIHQELLKLGEEYELLIGIGLLNWRTPSNHIVKRHLITARVCLEFEAHRGIFTVKSANGTNITNIEFDMLDVQDQPKNNVREMERRAKEHIGESVWDRGAMEPVLAEFKNELPSHGMGEVYWDVIKPEIVRPDETPRIEFAPALILRKRSVKGLQSILRKMLEAVTDGNNNIPVSFLELCESGNMNEAAKTGEEDALSSLPNEIYFPLQTNEEQREIIKAMNRSRGVLVQGPPGTGKTHTIANLICHLLATGQRILVTAKTPRALHVLHSKLPKDIQPLCISMLATGADEKQSLESSVSGIQNRIQQGDIKRNKDKIELLETKIRKIREEKARTENKLRAIREHQTYKHRVADGRYNGTAGEIARRINVDAEKFRWFSDVIPTNTAYPLTEQEVISLSNIFQHLKPESELLLDKQLPENERLPDPEKLKEWFDQEITQKATLEANSAITLGETGSLLKNVSMEQVRILRDELADFLVTLGNVNNRPYPWIRRAVQDVITDIDQPWRVRLKQCNDRLDKIRELSLAVQDLSITIPVDFDLHWLQEGVKALRHHFTTGGGMGFGPFKPKIIKEYKALIDKVFVNGRQCTSEETLVKLAKYLFVAINLKKIWELWEGNIEKRKDLFLLQIALLDEQTEALEKVLSLYDKKEKVLAVVQSIPGCSAPKFDDESDIKNYLNICEITFTVHAYKNLTIHLSAAKKYLSEFYDTRIYHPLCSQLCNAFERRDINHYAVTIKLIDELRTETNLVTERQRLLSLLAKDAPCFVEKIKAHNTQNTYRDYLPQLHVAWDFSRAQHWIKDMLSADVESLGRYLIQIEDETNKYIAELASLKAWNACIDRMSKPHQQHLTAWQQAMNRPGMRDGGVRAQEKRKDAQFQLEQCIDAVPGWIMPLHRVYDTIDPSPGMFDTIIVDEASQCGSDALPLFYLGKNILIVGDDKQISPEAVGVQQAPIQRLMDTYLGGFAFAASFDVTSSLYDHAARLFVDNKIILREHFRCMPEIIGFSNQLCYQAAPLIPLKQYLPDRLEPLKSVYIESGFRKGEGQKVVNLPEADALVRQLLNCCGDERYNDKTFGVIVLQGEAQANIIQQLLLKELGAEKIEKRKIVCGNAYSFQGDERDIIFLSMVAAPNSRIGTFSSMADQRRFNVAASRAKEQMWLFHSSNLNDLSPTCLRYRLLEYFTTRPPDTIVGFNIVDLEIRAIRDNRNLVHPPNPFDSWFEVDVALEIARRGYRIQPQYAVAGRRVDLVVQGAIAQLAVECDGDAWHGPEVYDQDMYRQRILERCGWQFVRIRECLFYSAKEAALQPLWDKLEELKIAPFEHNDICNDIEEIEEVLDAGELEEFEPANSDDEETNGQAESIRNGEGKRKDILISTGGIVPDNIHHALKIKKEEIEELVIEILQARPKNSCIKDKMASYILQAWKIRTSGAPKQEFVKIVDRIIVSMARKGYIAIYKSVNIRIKLGLKRYERQRVLL